jgi:hypothetical protein
MFTSFLFSPEPVSAQDSIIFKENFESTEIPSGWTQEKVVGAQDGSIVEWETKSGGHSGNPPAPAQGMYNAYFQYESYNGEATKLITPQIDLSNVTKPELNFSHAQDIWTASGSDWWDHLKVYYKKGTDSPWVLLKSYEEPVEEWTRQNILLPDSSLTSTYYIAFEGITNYGHGVCIDSVSVVESGYISKYIEEITYKQASTDFVPTGSYHNRILQLNVNVEGNEGEIILDSIAFQSLNSSDDHIAENGVKLYATPDTLFNQDHQLKGGINFVNGVVSFDHLNYSLPRGHSSLWLTYDLKEDTNHEMEGNHLDAKVNANSIKINGNYYYPLSDKSPAGNREIMESIFLDNFDTDQGWFLNGEFERAEPQGKGEEASGQPDPTMAFRGTKIIGNDLTFNGVYRSNLDYYEDSAVSPVINCKYFRDVKLNFYRWLNVDIFDDAYIHASNDGGETWNEKWTNPGFVTDNKWKFVSLDINDIAFRESEVKLRYSIGPTNGINDYTGWNLDNIIVTGDYIAQDVGITGWLQPVEGCGHSDSESVQVEVTNFGGDPTHDTIPLYYSFDGGQTKVRDTIFQSIPVDGSLTHPFSTPADLTEPGWYNNVIAETTLSADEDRSNDRFDHRLFIAPTYSPPYEENFESGYGYYRAFGDSSVWGHGNPNNTIIDTASSGSHVWITGTSSYYKNNDSSYLETPCFNFSSVRHPIIEFQLWNVVEEGKDGVTLYYSKDDGVNWNIVPEEGSYDWNWYTSANIEALATAGWDTSTTTWMEARQLLPASTIGASSIKFRFVFASDNIYRYDGTAIDDIKIYEAPPDVGVSAMTYPTSQCELSGRVKPEVEVTNYGIDTLFAGSKIPMGVKMNDQPEVLDTMELASYLAPGESTSFTFNDSLDMSYAGDYDLKVFTLLEDDPYFYSETNNDTLTQTVSVYGMPRYDIGHIVGIPESTDTTLDAGAGYTSYSWSTGSTNRTITVSSPGWYEVTVENDLGCTATDSVKVVNSDVNLAVTNINTTVSDACEHSVPVNYSVEISNMGLSDLVDGDTIPVAYQINQQEPVHDTLWLTQTVTNTGPDSTIDFTFSQGIDMSEAGPYTLKFYTNSAEDYLRSNDTSQTTVNTWGYPDTELRYDTLLTRQADSLTLDAGSGFDTYTWHDGSSGQTFDITHNRSQWYKVTVTDVHGCGDDSDSTHIIATDIGIKSLVYPTSSCEFTSSEQAVVRIKNYSKDTLPAGETIPMVLKVDGTPHSELITVNDSIYPDSTRDFTLSAVFDISSVGAHSFTVYSEKSYDAYHPNDTLRKEIHTWGYPDVEIARDTIYTEQADTVELDAGSGFDAYLWQDGNTNETYSVSENVSAQYKVTVSDAHGCGTDSDSVQVFTYDLGITERVSPKSSCELSSTENLQVEVKNFSLDTLQAGDRVPLGFYMEGMGTFRDTATLAENLLPGETFTHTFARDLDMSAFDTYHFEEFTEFAHDVNRSNDTLVDAIRTFGYPEFSLNYDTLLTTQADTVLLYPDIEENAYIWQDGTMTRTYDVTKNTTETYHLTVTDLNGCSYRDTAEIIAYDIGVDDLLNPASACALSPAEEVTLRVKNFGGDTLNNGMTLPVGYSLNGGTPVVENLVLSADLYPDSTVTYTFSGSVDLGSPGAYELTVFHGLTEDVNPDNDTLQQPADHYGYPSVDLGPDTLFTNEASTITLDAGSGHASYLWQDGSGGQTYDITSDASALYHVEVANSNGCTARDSVLVMATDIEMASLVTPKTGCGLGHQEDVRVKLYNNSGGNIAAGEVLHMGMITPQGTIHNDDLTLAATFEPGDTLSFTYSRNIDLSVPQAYELIVYVDYGPDYTYSNDTIRQNIESYLTPDPDLGPDTTLSAGSYLLDPGSFNQYEWHDGSNKNTFTVTAQNTTADSLYHVKVTNQGGCAASDTVRVELSVRDLSISSIQIPGDLCLPDELTSVELTLKNNGNMTIHRDSVLPLSYQLDSDNPIYDTVRLSTNMLPGETLDHAFSEKINLLTEGTYSLALSAGLNGDMLPSNNDSTHTIKVHAYPVMDLGPDTLDTQLPYTLDPGVYAAYEWQDGSTSSTYEVTDPGTYTLTVFNQYGCSTYDEIVIVEGTDINPGPGEDYSARVYPNPARDHLVVDLEAGFKKDFTIKLINNQGYLMQTRKVTLKQGRIQLNVQSLPRGIYYLRIETPKGMQTKKVIMK